jgi:hypothetical protein
MKSTILALLLSILTLSSFSQNITDLETYEKAMKPGTVLTYDVTIGETKYQFIVTLKKLGDEIVYDWKETGSGNKSGTVVMNANAVAKADALFADFKGGEAKLNDEVSLFISRKMFNEISSAAETSVKLAGASDTATVLTNTISEFNFNLNGALVAVPGWELEGGSEIKYILDVLESNKFPLIVKMDIGWTMQLAEIKNP